MWTYQISVDHCYCVDQPYEPGNSGIASFDWYTGYFPGSNCQAQIADQKLNSNVIHSQVEPLSACWALCTIYGTPFWTWNSGNALFFPVKPLP